MESNETQREGSVTPDEHERESDCEKLVSSLADFMRYDEFSLRVFELQRKYEAAMSEMKVRFEIINNDLQLKRNRNPIHHIESRMKTPQSMYEKIIRYGFDPTIENVEDHLMDIAGIRIITSYIQDVYLMLDALNNQDDLKIVGVKDYIANPKPNGYRSLHVIVKIPVYFMDSKQMIPVEVQVRTIAMDFWASLEHDLKYKASGELKGIDTRAELKECSDIIENVERRMQVLATALDEQSKGASAKNGACRVKWSKYDKLK